MSLEEFVCAVAVMHRGTAPEQLRMLFEVRCAESIRGFTLCGVCMWWYDPRVHAYAHFAEGVHFSLYFFSI